MIQFMSCRKIVHWKKHLKFPENSRLSPEAKDLIFRLLCDVKRRLGTGGAAQIEMQFNLSGSPRFRDVDWNELYEMEAAFKPEANGEPDTQNCMKFDEVEPPIPSRTGSGPSRKMLLTPKDLNFVGYTYKNFEAVKGSNNLLAKGGIQERQSSGDSTLLYPQLFLR
ncbi:hypothetical protein MLD38_006923 [Melastoma candidum]|uniref:Uncharacterized protein n=1 Tax=Melastoma candidum TaxID=119954 RepID=A0ACB9RP47_9MYRT|nr:hypothetical protein MLD38_006923 [Melastoma candidum]